MTKGDGLDLDLDLDMDLDIDLGDVDLDGDGPKKAEPAQTGPRAGISEDGKTEEGPLEKEATEELSELLLGFKQRARDEQVRFDQATQSDYWVTMVFQTYEQAAAFREAIGQPLMKYTDGYAVARKLGIELPPADVSYNDGSRQDLKLIALIAPKSTDDALGEADEFAIDGEDDVDFDA